MRKNLPLAIISLGLLSACSNASLQSSPESAMICIKDNIFVDAAMPAQQRKQFLQTVKLSKVEISKFFGGMKSSPDIYACSTKQCFRKFGGVPAKAKSFDDNKVLLSSKGLDKTTLTHELAHIEFHKRLGAPHLWNQVPMWFDEGLAVLACKDSKYSKPVAQMSLSKLVSQDQWINAVSDRKPAYSIAKQAVEKWYKGAGAEGLKAMIIRMQKGEEFSLTDSPKVQVSGLL